MKSFIILIASALCVVNAVDFTIRNNAGGAIWVGIMGNDQLPPLENGGFVLEQDQERTVSSDESWAGRFWARTWCNPDTNHCETGDCGDKLECAGSGGAPPASLAEIKLRGYEGQDFYDISLVDGFNVPASIEPNGGDGDCKPVKCLADINAGCPDELKLTGSSGDVIGCMSACSKYPDRDDYCCRGEYGPGQCNPDDWDVNSAKYFKEQCPDAYSFAYDDASSTFTCLSNSYKITFG